MLPQMAESELMPMPTTDPGWKLSVRLGCVAFAGAGTGALSGWVFRESFGGSLPGNWISWLPGTIYGLLWLAIGWLAPPTAVRLKYRRSWLWNLVFLLGVSLSFTAAYQVASQAASFLSDIRFPLKSTEEKLMLSGFLGGIPGGMGLACMLSLLYRGFDRWTTRSILTACSALLGVALALWPEEAIHASRRNGSEEKDFGIIAFFIIWQSGMAIAIVALDAAWRREKS